MIDNGKQVFQQSIVKIAAKNSLFLPTIIEPRYPIPDKIVRAKIIGLCFFSVSTNV
jgi:hypothetical protein